MKLREILPLLIFTFFSIVTFSQNYQESSFYKIYLDNNVHREIIEVDENRQSIEVCNLEEYSSYVISISEIGKTNSDAVLREIGKNVEDMEIHFLATGSCHVFELLQKRPSKLNLSISKHIEVPKNEEQDLSKSVVVPITVSGSSAQNLIENVFIGGGCFDVNNVTLSGNSNAIGEFSNGMSSIGIDNGVLISTGHRNNILGPNNQTNAGTNFFGISSDPDLQQVNSSTGNTSSVEERTVIEFDFTPTLNTISFEYVFASEEYCDFVNASFNDVFGFFISGPGIAGPFTGGADNIALIPGTSDYVTINSVNFSTNSTYYVDNVPIGQGQNSNGCVPAELNNPAAAPNDIEFDGYTTILTATANVIPCSTYHIKLAIGDVGDGSYDSGVFLKANSFNAGGAGSGTAFNPVTGSNIFYEQCGTNGQITFEVDGADPTLPFDITYTIDPASTATAGLDYTAFPNPITVPAGQTTFSIPVIVVDDGIGEGTENIILNLDNPCSCTDATIEIIIEEVQPIVVDLPDQSICGNGTVTLTPTITGGVQGGTFTYQWDNGTSNPSLTDAPTGTTTYSVTVTDACGSTGEDSATITVNDVSSANIAGNFTICAGAPAPSVTIPVNFTGTGPWTFIYAIDGVDQPPVTTSDNPFDLMVTTTGTVSLVSVENGMGPNGNGCPGTVAGNVPVTEVTITPNLTPMPETCAGFGNGEISTTVAGGTTPYSYSWSNGGPDSPTQNGLPPGFYQVTVTDLEGCTGVASTDITSPPPMTASANGIEANCSNMGGSLSASGSGGTPNYTYNWSNGSTGSNPSNVLPGTYTVTVSDINGCTAEAMAIVDDNTTPPDAFANGTGIVDCITQVVSIDGNGSSVGGGINYQWSGPGIVNGGNTLNPTVNAGGAYTITVTDTGSGCTAEATVNIPQDNTPPTANANGNDLDCNNQVVNIDGIGSSVGGQFSYQWSGAGIVSGGTTLNLLVDQPGSYTITVTDNNNGCTSEATVSVNDNSVLPNAVAQGPQLDCGNSTVSISGNGSTTGSNMSYNWSGPNIISGGNSLNPTIDQPGTYTITVTNNQTGCTNEATVNIIQDLTPPTVSINPVPPFGCIINNQTINASGSIGGNFNYQWNGPNIVSGANSLNPVINGVGTYTLVITDSNNGCTADASIMVDQQIILPTVDVLPPGELDCNITQTILDGSNSQSGSGVSYSWLSNNGNILSGGNTNTALVNAGGTYTLVVSDANTGCSDQITVNVTDNTNFPNSEAGPNQSITCNQQIAVLDGTASQSGPNISYQWIDENGNLIDTDPLISVNTPGTYQLVVTDGITGCTGSDLVTVEANENIPTANIFTPDEINCFNATVTITSFVTGNGVDITWSTQNGNIVSGANSENPVVNASGTYDLLLLDPTTGCSSEYSIAVDENVDDPEINILPPELLDCSNGEIIIDASNSVNGNDYNIAWFTNDGNIVSGGNTLTPTVNAGGTYTLNISNSNNGCSNDDLVFVADNFTYPNISIQNPDLITCTSNEVDIDATNSSNGGNYIYQWNTNGGTIISGGNTLNPTVGSTGVYELVITDLVSQCSTSDFVEVQQDANIPVADAGQPDLLDCQTSEIILDGTVTGGTNLSINWTTNDGNILTGGNTLNPEINAAGTYIINVVNLDNNCETSSQVIIDEDLTIPNAEIFPTTEITCTDPTLILDASDSDSNPNLNISWSTNDGSIVAGGNSLFPEIGTAGTYVLNIFNPNNNCESSAEITVDENNEIPTADAGGSQTMGCGDDFVELSGAANSNSNPFLDIEWTTQNGSITGDATSLNPTVDEPGVYIINVTDPTNGCAVSAEVEIFQNTETPEIAIGNGGEITCNQTFLELNANVTGNTGNYIYQWQTNDGNIASGATSLNPNVDAAGVYQLVVIDTINNCTDADSLIVTEDADIPEALVESEGGLNCTTNSVLLDASSSTTGAGVTFEWTSDDGNFVDGQNTLTPTVNGPGLYTLTIIDSNNNCTNSTGVTIEMDTLAPQANIGNPDILTCDILEVELDASNSTNTGDLAISWESTNGNFVSGIDSLNPIVNEPGLYVLNILNNENGCESSTSIEVTEQVENPILVIEEPDELNCFNNTVSLNATNSDNGATFQIEWTTDNGNIITGDDALNPVIDEPGIYNLLITNSLNGCESMDEITVIEDIVNPEAVIEPADILNCNNLSLILNGENSSNGGIYEYQWTSTEGDPILDENTLNPTIDQPGEYQLLVTNITNGCTDSELIVIDQNIEFPTADAGNEDELTCSITELNLDAGLSTQSDEIEYSWTTNGGNIVNGDNSINPLIDAPGLYTIQVLNAENGCSTTADVLITQDANIPEADAGVSDDLTCVIEEIILNGENSQIGNNITYLWTTNDGNILNGDSTLTPTIGEPGTYTLIVSNTLNNCSSTSSVIVDENLLPPNADAGQTSELSCAVETLDLNGEMSSIGDDFSYDWTTQNGNIIAGNNSINPTIDAPGIYSIIVTNDINGCTAENSVEITQSLDVPIAVINSPAELNCVTDEIELDASPSSQGTDFEYVWTTPNGTIISGNNSLNPLVGSPGVYQILVTNNDNGCTNSFPIEVVENLIAPDAEAGQTNELTCTITSLELNGEGSSNGQNFTYNWITNNGNISNGNNSINPTITAPGTYQIIVTDEFNGCTSTDFVEITADENVPFSVIAQPDQLTCAVETLILDGTTSSQGTDFEFIWTTSNGNITNGETTLEPMINSPGVYELLVTNNDNGCTSLTEVTVTQNIETPTVDAGDPFTLNCYEDIQFLIGTGNANGSPIGYQWSTTNGIIASGENSASVGVSSGGLYNLTVVNLETGCENSDNVIVVEDVPLANREPTQPLCYKDLGAIGIYDVQGGTPPYLYSIDGGDTYFGQTLFNDLSAGIYQVAVQDANGCVESQAVELVEPDEVNVVLLQSEMTIKQGETVQLNVLTNIPTEDIAEIVWTPSHGLSCTDCLDPVASPEQTVVYKVTVANKNGCSDNTPFLLIVNKQSEIHVPNIFSPNGDGDNDVFMIFTNDQNIKEIKSFLVFNRWGETVYQYFHFPPNNPAYGWDGMHRGQALNPAVFAWFAEVEFTDGRIELIKGDVTLTK